MRDVRWSEADPELPSELSELLRAGRDQLGSAEEVAELGRRVSAVLGPAAGLPNPPPPAQGEQTAGSGSVGGAPAGGTIGAPTLTAAAYRMWAAGSVALAVAVGVTAFVLGRSSSAPVRAPSAAVVSTSAPTPPDALGSTPREPAHVVPTPASDASPAPAARAEPEPAPAAQAAQAATPERPAAPRAKARAGSRARSVGISETQLLERARAALQVRPAEALELTRRHRARFPSGALAQEREVIAIEALERLGRTGAAKARAAEFERRYRGSVHAPRLERAADTSVPAGGALNTAPR